MARSFNRLLVSPDEESLLQALRDACALDCMASWRFSSRCWQTILDELAEKAQGQLQLNAPREAALYLVVAWWTDHQGGGHVRIAGGDWSSGQHPHFCRMDEDLRPPLWHVYPERIFRVHRTGQAPVWLASCACGATGQPEELAWMGPSCGPCHDRREEGETPPFADRPARLLASCGPVYALAFSPDGETLAVSSRGRQLNLHDLRNGGPTLLYGGDDSDEDEEFRPVVISPDGRFLAAGDPEESLVRVWNLERLEEAPEEELLDVAPNAQPTGLAFAPDGDLLAACTPHSWHHLWGCDENVWVALSAPTGDVTSVCFSPDGQTLALGCNKGAVDLFGCNKGAVDLFGIIGESKRLSTGAGENHYVLFIDYTPDSRRLVLITGNVDSPSSTVLPDSNAPVGGRENCQLHLWDLEGDREVMRADIPSPSCVALSPDGRWLAMIVHDLWHSPAEIVFWDVQTLQEAARLQWNTEDNLRALAFSPDGQILATGSVDGVVKLIPWQLLLEG